VIVTLAYERKVHRSLTVDEKLRSPRDFALSCWGLMVGLNRL